MWRDSALEYSQYPEDGGEMEEKHSDWAAEQDLVWSKSSPEVFNHVSQQISFLVWAWLSQIFFCLRYTHLKCTWCNDESKFFLMFFSLELWAYWFQRESQLNEWSKRKEEKKDHLLMCVEGLFEAIIISLAIYFSSWFMDIY